MFTMRVGRAIQLTMLVAAAAAAPAKGAEDTAKDKMPSSGAVMMKMDPKEVFQMMDPDKKGYVTKEEFMKFEQELFDKWDKDKNGQVSMAEFTDKG
jgi:EF-hand domain pair